MPDSSVLLAFLGAGSAVAALLVCCTVVGFAAIPARMRPPRAGPHSLLAISAGTTIVTWVTWVAGAAIGTWATLPAVGLLVALSATRLRGLRGVLRGACRHLLGLAGAAPIASAALLVLLLLLIPQLFLPPCDSDGLRYHLALPKYYLLLGRVVHEPFGLGSTYPQSGEMLYLLGLQFAGGQTAKLVHATFFVLGLAALGLAVHRDRRTRAAAPLAAALFAASPVAITLASAAFVDHVALFHIGVAVLLLMRRGSPFQVGAALAGGLATKLTVAPTAVVIAIWVLARVGRRRRIVAALALTLPTVFAIVPLALRNTLRTGDPIYPVGHVLLGRPIEGLTPEALRYTTSFSAGVAGPLGVAWGPGEAPSDEVAGWHHLAGLAATAVAVRLPAARVLLLPVAAELLTGMVLRPPTRLLLPLLWGLAGLEALALVTLRRRWVLWLGLVAAAPAAFLSARYLVTTFRPFDLILGRVDRAGFLARTVPGYGAALAVDQQPPGGQVMALDFPAPYYFDRPWIVEGMLCDPPLLLWLRHASSPDDLLGRLHSLDVRYIVVTPRYGGGSARSLVALAQSAAQARILTDLRARLRLVTTDAGCDVYAVPPPASPGSGLAL